MHMNLIPPPGVKGSSGLVIKEPESWIFFYNRNFDLVFQREEVFHLATIAQLIRTQSAIKREIRLSIEDPLSTRLGGIKDSLSTKHQRVVKDLLSAKPRRATSDLVCRRNTLTVLRRVRGGNTLTILLPFEEEQAEVKLFSMEVSCLNQQLLSIADSISAKELFNACKQCGHVVDTFIPTKRSKTEKRFSFVRFINVFNVERLVNNLCTVWIDRFKLYANIARFNRAPVKFDNHATQYVGGSKSNHINKDKSNNVVKKEGQSNGLGRTYMHVVKGQTQPGVREEETVPALVMMEFANEESLKLFRDNVSVRSWFPQVKQASLDFVTEGGIAWVEIEGIPFKVWSGNTSKRIAAKWGKMLDIDDQEEMCFHSKRLCIHTKNNRSISKDIKIIFRGKAFGIRAKETPRLVPDFTDDVDDEDQNDDEIKYGGSNGQETGSGSDSDAEEVPKMAFKEEGQNNGNGVNNNTSVDSMKYPPPGFTPNAGSEASCMNKEDGTSNNFEKANDVNVDEDNNTLSGNCCSKNSKEGETDSACSGHFKKSQVPHTGGSILNFLDEVVKVRQVMKYKMDGCVSKMAKIIESQNSFVMVRGVWRQNGMELLLITVYAPHDFKETLLLWDYLNHTIGRWKGEVIIMGDFNEVRYKSDRFGSIFNAQGANAFNSFISSAGLIEVSLGGCSFKWCYKSATKMSKLDRFLVSESLFNTCPNMSAITLERFLSDHRPIFLRESYFDYGLTPFRFFHYWSDMEGFGKVVEGAWKECPNVEHNAMINMIGKLKYLKKKIREWNIKNKQRGNNDKGKHKADLEALDMIIDQGNGSEEIVQKRSEFVTKLLHIDKLNSKEMAQKAKIKWYIEGTMTNGSWVDEPIMVKREFFNHFSNRFAKPDGKHFITHMSYPRQISLNQQMDLESKVSNDEIKRVVWDCGTDKAPGPDGFTFGFYRRFWYRIDNDVYVAVKHFFICGEIPKGCNSSFIALIPKIPDANLVKYFRPISLIRSLYKIIAKILANRLVGVLGDIVNEVQSAFVVDRQILDGPLILNEVIQWCKSKKKQSLVFKVDFEKAYDSVRWDFLDDILGKFCFGEKWCRWIQSCLKSSRGSIIINGSRTKEFQFFKGIKQGDPLSPFLFILIMEN
uniref:Putative RNA-directed DNA polymerase, eukaryota, reverse transcriptase zinc-binding domain protein n=1 Tax=Tanacetum cinerariifolium TaxID=118510 RepID=A0A699HKF0_TANCI|nr:putative RNA-directed DNA polymerase, eukaryota, reverse transcriptase zinc-binding domain protein [Tanacetum cinerariifolium]